MYKPHDLFVPPPSGATLWRYLDFTKFVSLLDRSGLFFVRADKLGDPFEGSYTKINRAMRPALYEGKIPEERLSELYEYVKRIRRYTLISCWHWSAHESAAMWRLYSRERDGIAIRTTFESLVESLTGEDSVHIGTVNYVDYEETFIPENNTMAPFLFKRKGFEHEHEVRALIQQTSSRDGKIDLSHEVYEVGVYQSVDLSVLVREVVVAPYAEDWLLELVTSVAGRYGLKAPVLRSSLAEDPVWS